MNGRTRTTIVAVCFSVCASAAILSFSSGGVSTSDDRSSLPDAIDLADGYQYAASAIRQKFNFNEVEVIIRRDPATASRPGRIEFGSVKLEGGSALVEVLFFAPDGAMQPFLYKLVPEKSSWKVESVQRMWFVPRSHFVRGLLI